MNFCERILKLFSNTLEEFDRVEGNKYRAFCKNGDILESRNPKWIYKTVKWMEENDYVNL